LSTNWPLESLVFAKVNWSWLSSGFRSFVSARLINAVIASAFAVGNRLETESKISDLSKCFGYGMIRELVVKNHKGKTNLQHIAINRKLVYKFTA